MNFKARPSDIYFDHLSISLLTDRYVYRSVFCIIYHTCYSNSFCSYSRDHPGSLPGSVSSDSACLSWREVWVAFAFTTYRFFTLAIRESCISNRRTCHSRGWNFKMQLRSPLKQIVSLKLQHLKLNFYLHNTYHFILTT